MVSRLVGPIIGSSGQFFIIFLLYLFISPSQYIPILFSFLYHLLLHLSIFFLSSLSSLPSPFFYSPTSLLHLQVVVTVFKLPLSLLLPFPSSHHRRLLQVVVAFSSYKSSSPPPLSLLSLLPPLPSLNSPPLSSPPPSRHQIRQRLLCSRWVGIKVSLFIYNKSSETNSFYSLNLLQLAFRSF